MQIKLIPAAMLFLGSYFPLALILAVQDIKPAYWEMRVCTSLLNFANCEWPSLQNPAIVWSFFAITSLSLIFFITVLKSISASTEMIIEDSKSIPNDLINYVFPYIVSFMGVDLSEHGKVIGLGMFMSWLFLLGYRSGQILMNPILLVMGWQLYEIRADIEGHKRSLRALSKHRVLEGQTLKSCLVQGMYVLMRKV